MRSQLDVQKKSAHALEQDGPDVLKQRQEWFDGQPELDPERLVFIDETGISTNMARLRGRAPRGERCRAGVPHGHWKTTTFTGALRRTGMTAPFVYDGAMNAEVFLAYVEQVLVPTLRPGDLVIKDNLPAHKVRAHLGGDRDGWRHPHAPAALSPDFNPIENAFAELKALRRAGAARTIDAQCVAIGSFIRRFSSAEYANCLMAAGCEPD